MARLARERRHPDAREGARLSVAATTHRGAVERLEELLARRTDANRRFFAAESDRLARLCHRMAERFARGGRLLGLGATPSARSDARHVAVEFVHPVIVGKRALPAIAITGDTADLARDLRLLAGRARTS